jgi:hypothetical protein
MPVVQLMVAEVDVIPVTVTAAAEMTNGAVPDVVNVKFSEVAVPPAPVVDTMEKLYLVPGVSPDSGTAW